MMGFNEPPQPHVLVLLFVYALTASAMMVLNKHLARAPWFNAVLLVQIQLAFSVVLMVVCYGVGLLKNPLFQVQGGTDEIAAWMLLALAFTIQLAASIMTLKTPMITQWYMLLHYLTPCLVPFLERRVRAIVLAGEAPPLATIIFPILTFASAAGLSYYTAGVFGPGTSAGVFWSVIWVAARMFSLVGSRAIILQFETPLANRLFFQNVFSLTIVTIVVIVWPSLDRMTVPIEQVDDASEGAVNGITEEDTQYVIAACVCGFLVGLCRLELLGSTTASTFSILSSIGVVPARMYFAGSNWLGFMATSFHHH